MEAEELTTERLRLRKITPEVIHSAFEKLTDPQLLAFLGLASLAELEQEKAKYKKGISTHDKTFLYFQLLDQETATIIGWGGFHTWYTNHQRAEMGYGLTTEAFKGRGLMTEALLPIIRYGFEVMQLSRIEAFVGPANSPSLGLMKKLNFVKEGQLRNHYFKNNHLEDSLAFSLLKEEYEQNKSSY